MDTKAKIVEALQDLSAKKSVAELTLAEIARTAGLSQPTVSRHVGGPDGLIGFATAHDIEGAREGSERQDVKAQILEAAFRVFAEKGYSGTSMDTVASEAGMTKGAVYWHFENKRDLFRELMLLRSAEGVEIASARIEDATAESGGVPVLFLSNLIEHQIVLSQEERHWWWLFFEYLAEARDGELRDDLASGLARLLQSNEQLIAAMKQDNAISGEIDDQGMSVLWQAMLIGFGYLNLMNSDFLQNQDIGSKIAHSLWNGLKP